jgi:hypothetical protein
MNIRDRYDNDPAFRQLVDLMTIEIERGIFTLTEIREAAMCAQINFEARHPRPTSFTAMDVKTRKV